MQFNVIAYRDVCDGKARDTDKEGDMAKRLQFKCLIDPSKADLQAHFTESVEEVKAFLDGLKASGGGDVPEDISGALLKASFHYSFDCHIRWLSRLVDLILLSCIMAFVGTQVSELKWDPTATNILFHIFDGPNHGCKFNELGESNDHFYDKPPHGRADPAEEIRRAIERLKSCNVLK